MLKTNEIYNMDCMEGLKLLDNNPASEDGEKTRLEK